MSRNLANKTAGEQKHLT